MAATNALGSDWTGLSDYLIAKFYPIVRVKGSDGAYRWEQDSSQPEVHAPLTDGSIDSSFGWHSAFEGVGADQKWSAISALLQTGAIREIADTLNSLLFKDSNSANGMVASFEGKTSLTKLNSTQVFNSLPPTKISFTAHFRAFSDPAAEVAAPVNQLIQWAYPQELASDGPLLEAIKSGSKLSLPDSVSFYPSKVPRIIAMKYAGSTYMPLVIEHLPQPLTPPRDAKGRMLHAQLAMSVASLSALDANDWRGGWSQQ